MLLVPERTHSYVEEVDRRLRAGDYAAAASSNLSYARMAELLMGLRRKSTLPFLYAATVTDITGVTMYLGLATLLLGGMLPVG